MPSNRRSAPPRRSLARHLFRRGGFFAGWLVCVLLSFMLLAGAAMWVLYQNPTGTARLGVELFAADEGIEVGEIDLDTPGEIRIRDLSLAGAKEGDKALQLDQITLHYSGRGFDLIKEGSVESVEVVGGKVKIDDALLAKYLPAGSAGPTIAGEESSAFEVPAWMERAVPKRVSVSDFEAELALEAYPRASGRVGVELSDLESLLAGASGGKRQVIVLDGWRVEGDEGEAAVELGKVEVELDVAEGFGRIDVARVAVSGGASLRLTPDLLEPFLEPGDPSAPAPELPEVTLGELAADGINLSLSGFAGLPDVSGVGSVELAGLKFVDGELKSAAEQRIVVSDAKLTSPGAEGDDVLVRGGRAEVHVIPDALFQDLRIAQIHMRGFDLDVNKAALGDYAELFTGAGDAAESTGGDADGAPFSPEIDWPGVVVENLKLEQTSLAIDPTGLFAGLPLVSAQIDARSEGEAPQGDVAYAFEITKIEAHETAASKVPFAKGAGVSAEFTALGLQERGVIDKVEVRGVRAEVGEEVNRLVTAFMGDGEAQPFGPGDPGDDCDNSEKEEADEGGGVRLSIAELRIRDTVFTIRDLIPTSLPYLPLSIDATLEEVPLLGRSAGDEREQRVELKGLQIASPYNTLQNAAELKTVWVYFTIPGLLRSEIRRVEIVSPDLYVGEPLFWYVDYARKYASGEMIDGEEVAAGKAGEPGEEGEGGAVPDDAIVEGLKAFEVSGWRLGELEAHSGRIIVAPTGIPLGIVPFPFNAKTDFAAGKIELKVEVPTGDYVFENLEIELKQLSGEAFLNYPVATENNNFVQTFRSPLVRFKQFEGTELWLSVTYDRYGIYGKFGGSAYGGYVNGEFNLYIEGPYKWDAWVSGHGVDLGALTDILAPEQFKMSAVVDGKFVAAGQEFSVHKASGEIHARDGGEIHVLKLDDLRDALPDDWDPLWKALANAGIDALRDYRFADGDATVEYGDKEGEAEIRFHGIDGERHVRLRYFDKRSR